MSLLAEQLVDEWMNRQGFFTIRGVRDGVSEIDLLGVRETDGHIEAWHIESQVSFRPVSYVSPLTDALAKRYGKKKTSAWKRPIEVTRECVEAWIEKKFEAPRKRRVRETLWPNAHWKKIFVHGVIKNPEEEAEFSERLKMLPFHQILQDICFDAHGGYRGSAGTDIADIVAYFEAMQAIGQSR